jgi:hypothetical protein
MQERTQSKSSEYRPLCKYYLEDRHCRNRSCKFSHRSPPVLKSIDRVIDTLEYLIKSLHSARKLIYNNKLPQDLSESLDSLVVNIDNKNSEYIDRVSSIRKASTSRRSVESSSSSSTQERSRSRSRDIVARKSTHKSSQSGLREARTLENGQESEVTVLYDSKLHDSVQQNQSIESQSTDNLFIQKWHLVNEFDEIRAIVLSIDLLPELSIRQDITFEVNEDVDNFKEMEIDIENIAEEVAAPFTSSDTNFKIVEASNLNSVSNPDFIPLVQTVSTDSTSSINSAAPQIPSRLELLEVPKDREPKVKIDPRIIRYLDINSELSLEAHNTHNIEKLNLVIDIDQTLLEAMKEEDMRLPPRVDFKMISFTAKNKVFKYIVSLRPGLNAFLTNISRFSKLWIYTASNLAYLTEILKIVDPEGIFFQNRFICAEDNEKMNFKYLKNITQKFPDFDESLALIIDDKIGAWPKDAVRVIPTMAFSPLFKIRDFLYHHDPRLYFEDVKSRYLDDEQEDKNQLSSLSSILEATYKEFLKQRARVTAAFAFDTVRKRTLRGTIISFRKYEERLDHKVYKNRKYLIYKYMCELLGASITQDASDAMEIVESVDKLNLSSSEVCSSDLIKSFFHLKPL